MNVGDSAQLVCPDPADFCNEWNTRCQNDCNAHGLCTRSKICSCAAGWSGGDCSTQVPLNYAEITAGGYASSSIFKIGLAMIFAGMALYF